jgi:putative FmdB family regulatory protein
MPIYEYLCPECGLRFEKLRPLSQADKEVTCPGCGKPARRRPSTFACFSTSNSGVPTRIAGNGSSCSSCSSNNCSTCGL